MGLRSLGYGQAGQRGLQGPIGERGPTGQTGAQGAKGDIGPIGGTGPQGPTGATGATGATGPVGPQGAKGDTGATGPQGPAGPSAGALALVGALTVSETAVIAITVGIKRKAITLSGVSTADRLFFTETGAPTNGCGVISVRPTANNQVTVSYYTPALAIGASFAMPIAVYRLT